MKHTECRICGQNLEDMPYNRYEAHINKHLKSINDQKDQTTMDEYD